MRVRIGPAVFEAEVLNRSKMGEVYIKMPDGQQRWVPADWVVEE